LSKPYKVLPSRKEYHGCYGFQPIHSQSTTSETSGCVGVTLSETPLIQYLGIGHAVLMRVGLVFTCVLHVPPQDLGEGDEGDGSDNSADKCW
jgi:hypothetical protein